MAMGMSSLAAPPAWAVVVEHRPLLVELPLVVQLLLLELVDLEELLLHLGLAVHVGVVDLVAVVAAEHAFADSVLCRALQPLPSCSATMCASC